ncbi:MAG TPA: hypothetical protein VIH82_09885 [Acidimicrobiia bacterium]|jgi:hypothetical protein
MAKPRSSKYTRARIRARGRRRQRRGGTGWFYGAVGVVVAVFVALIVVTISSRGNADAPPQPGNPATGEAGDHWHAAFAVNVCGEWLSNPPTFETAADNANVRVGIHTHGDGFIHIHPFTKSEGGDHATLGRFLTYGGWDASEDSLSLWTGPASASNAKQLSDGDKCPAGTPFAGKTGVVKWSVDCAARQGNPSDFKPSDGDVIALAFLPKGEKIGVPPNASAAPSNDGGSNAPLNNKGCSTAGPGGTTSTTPTGAPSSTGSTDATTGTTAAPAP